MSRVSIAGHLELRGPSLVCVGTSATVGHEQADAVCAFASDLFADRIDRAGLIAEQSRARASAPATLEAPPSLDDGELAVTSSWVSITKPTHSSLNPRSRRRFQSFAGGIPGRRNGQLSSAPSTKRYAAGR